jgi:hypothetical protein
MLSLCAKVVQGLLPFCDDGSKASLACLTKLSADPCNLAFVDGFGRNGGRFDVEKGLDKHAQLTGKPKSHSIQSGEKRKHD